MWNLLVLVIVLRRELVSLLMWWIFFCICFFFRSRREFNILLFIWKSIVCSFFIGVCLIGLFLLFGWRMSIGLWNLISLSLKIVIFFFVFLLLRWKLLKKRWKKKLSRFGKNLLIWVIILRCLWRLLVIWNMFFNCKFWRLRMKGSFWNWKKL